MSEDRPEADDALSPWRAVAPLLDAPDIADGLGIPFAVQAPEVDLCSDALRRNRE